MKNKKGFTLIELLAVIVILAILITTAIPAVSRYLDSSRKDTYVINVKQALNAVITDVNVKGVSGEKIYSINEINSLLDKKLNKSSYGKTYDSSSYIKVTMVNDKPVYQICIVDTSGNGIYNSSTIEKNLFVTGNPEDDECSSVTFDYKRDFTYNGKACVVSEENPNICEIEENDKIIYRAEETDGVWKIKFLESGTFVSLVDITIDVFLVGGGGNGSAGSGYTGGGGGGGGYTETFESISLYKDANYEVEVGLASQPSKFIDNDYEYIALPGLNGGAGSGGNGGSGGGGAHSANNQNVGGSNGSNGTGNAPGIGQSPKNTREFGEADGDLYAGGGGGYNASAGGLGGGGNGAGPQINASNGTDNTGGGGGGTYKATAGIGGSGIVVIREHGTTNN